jgi:hypothetical protein
MATSKACWAGMERHIAKLLGTSRQYGQSAKSSRFKDPSMLGDVKTEQFLIECKLRDYAPPAFRKNHPRKFYTLFSVKNEWWKGIKKEAAMSDRIPVLIIKPKYGQDEDMIVIMRSDELPEGKYPKFQENTDHKVMKSSIKLKLEQNQFPWEFETLNDCLIAIPFPIFLGAVNGH